MEKDKKIMFFALAIFIVCITVFLSVKYKKSQTILIQKTSAVANPQPQEVKHPDVPLSLGESIVWYSDTSFGTYSTNIPANERIINISDIQKTQGGYTLSVGDNAYVQYGNITNGSIDTGEMGGIDSIPLRGPVQIFLPESVSPTFIRYTDQGEAQPEPFMTALGFFTHFTANTCASGQYGCDDFRKMYWGVTLDSKNKIISMKQKYQE